MAYSVWRVMTKFGKYLEETQEPEYRQHYVRYKLLKQILGEIVSRNASAGTSGGGFDLG